MQIKKVEVIDDLDNIQPIYLNCILMENNEIMFDGKSLGFLTDEQIKKYVFIKEETK